MMLRVLPSAMGQSSSVPRNKVGGRSEERAWSGTERRRWRRTGDAATGCALARFVAWIRRARRMVPIGLLQRERTRHGHLRISWSGRHGWADGRAPGKGRPRRDGVEPDGGQG